MSHPDKEKVLTVSQISAQIRQSLESQFSAVWIKGELSNFKAHSSGHWYFSLKDEQSQIKGVMFRRQNQKIPFKPQTGEEVLVQGQVSVYTPRGDYQILCHEMELVGSGLLQKQFEEIKRKLKAEGLFEPSRKKPLPRFPRHVSLITSETGAAVRDILNILKRRFRSVKVTLIPALVQGSQAVESLLNGLEACKKIPADVVIIGRGGGSMEDLWAFNDEALARAIAQYPVPVISAVGHEIDFTICDFVSDLRAPTPSAAAELVVQNREDLLDQIQQERKRFIQSIKLQLSFFKDRLSSLQRTLISPQRTIQDFSQSLDESSLRFYQSMQKALKSLRQKLEQREKVLLAIDPKKVMERGFSIITDSKGILLSSASELKARDRIHIDFFKGQALAEVLESNSEDKLKK